MKREFIVWTHKLTEGSVALDTLEGVDDDFELLEGISVAQRFPPDATYTMSAQHPKDTVLTDSLYNTDRLIVVSQPLKELLEAQGGSKVEYLPVTVINHKKKPVKPGYFIVNALDPVDCLDPKQSGAKFWATDPTSIMSLARLVIDESKVPGDRSLFRARGYDNVLFVRRTLAEAMAQQGYTGVRFVEIDDYRQY